MSNWSTHSVHRKDIRSIHKPAMIYWISNICIPFQTRRRNDRLTMLYRIQHGLVDIHSDSYLQQSDRRTRGEHRLYQIRTGSETYSYSFFQRTIRDWNMLPSRTTSAPTLEGFRTNLAVCHPVSSY